MHTWFCLQVEKVVPRAQFMGHLGTLCLEKKQLCNTLPDISKRTGWKTPIFIVFLESSWNTDSNEYKFHNISITIIHDNLYLRETFFSQNTPLEYVLWDHMAPPKADISYNTQHRNHLKFWNKPISDSRSWYPTLKGRLYSNVPIASVLSVQRAMIIIQIMAIIIEIK